MKKEFDVSSYFAQRPRHVVDKAVLAEAVWGIMSINPIISISFIRRSKSAPQLEEAGGLENQSCVRFRIYKLID